MVGRSFICIELASAPGRFVFKRDLAVTTHAYVSRVCDQCLQELCTPMDERLPHWQFRLRPAIGKLDHLDLIWRRGHKLVEECGCILVLIWA